MIDLHFHTLFSDGNISDIEYIIKNCNIISITDHNSIMAYKYLDKYSNFKKIILGCEITVDRAPDYLIYFPKIDYSEIIENELKEIRLTEENIIKSCYYHLGYTDWEKDIKRAFVKEQRIMNMRTRDLAAIIHLYKTGLQYDNGNFDYDDLEIARKYRRKYAENIGNSVSENIAFDIANKHNGKIVLAHPIHTALKRCKKNNINLEVMKLEIVKLIDSFVKKEGKIIEWEYFSPQHLKKYNFSNTDIENLKKVIYEKSNEYELNFTIGSDSHSLEKYDNVLIWLKENEKIISDKLPKWLFN